jgi:hypothetical protein
MEEEILPLDLKIYYSNVETSFGAKNHDEVVFASTKLALLSDRTTFFQRGEMKIRRIVQARLLKIGSDAWTTRNVAPRDFLYLGNASFRHCFRLADPHNSLWTVVSTSKMV